MMELDVNLTRSSDEPWGFRLIGGVDFNMPLTVVKVLPNSPADLAGLRNGDTVSSINGADATSLTHEDSKKVLAVTDQNLSLGVVRGLYDPVLDDFEPLYEPTDQEDFDQPSQPTEVPDYLDLTLTLPEFANGAPKPLDGTDGLFKPIPELNGQNPDSRSITASPFLIPTKPYRPFSTEPLPEIPALEQPIILNPTYHEEFGKLKDFEEFLPKTRFKLPISEQYDPDSTRQKAKMGIKKEETTKDSVSWTDSKTVREEIVKKDFEMKDEIITKEEVKFLEKMKKEIDLENIEMTATLVVDESIQKAVTVAEEIKREIDVELSESDSETSRLQSATVKESTKTSEISSSVQKDMTQVDLKTETAKEVTELVEKTSQEIIKQNDYNEETQMSHISESESVVDNKESKQKIAKAETIVSDEKISEVSLKTEDITESQKVEKDVQRKVSKQKTKIDQKDSLETNKMQAETMTKDTKSETKFSTSKLLSEQRAYTIGLQTIPNIRGTVHSSYHYDLLLRTFFIHLTDVMVALSRFILAEPVAPVEQETKKDVTKRQEKQMEVIAKEIISADKQETALKEEARSSVKEKIEAKATEKHEKAKTTVNLEKTTKVVTPAKKEKVVGKILQKAHEIKEQESDLKSTKFVEEKKVSSERKHEVKMDVIDEGLRREEIVKTREISGYKMAQLTDRKPEELMQKLEAVLTEFESKSSNEDIEMVRERRSKSRSRVETPVDQMYLDKSYQEVNEVSLTGTSAITNISESKTSKTEESKFETMNYESSTNDAKTYIAIVESHVYTNKDAIFDISKSQAESSEIVTKESPETIKAEKVATETIEKAVQAVVETSDKLVSAEKEEKIQVSEKTEKRELIQEVQKVEEKAIEKETKFIQKPQDVVIEEVTLPMVEEVKSTFIQDYTVTEAEEKIETSKSEFVSEEETISVKEETISFAKQDNTVKQENIAIKQEIVSIKEEPTFFEIPVVTEASKEKIVIKDEIVAKEKAVKEEVAVIKEEIKEETTVAKESVTEIKKEEVIAAEEKVKIDTVKDESVSIAEETTALKEVLVQEKVEKQEVAVKEFEGELFSLQSTKEENSMKQESVDKVISFKQESVVAKELAIEEKDELATLKISKEEIIEKETTSVEVDDQVDMSFKKVEIKEFESKSQSEHIESKHAEIESTFVAKSVDQETTFVAKSLDQESTFVAKSTNQESTVVAKSVDAKEAQKLTLRTDLAQKKVETQISEESTIDTPTLSTVPPTPLTDEYVFTLVTKLPKREGTPIPRDCTPSDSEDEDPHIVKKGLVPRIDANIEDQKIFDPPLPSPPISPKSPTSPRSPRSPTSPVYVKPGLRGGAPPPKPRNFRKEEIKEIELKSSLLASAIDETIKSIEEYKQEVGIKKEVTTEVNQNGVMYNGYAKVVETKVYDTVENSIKETKGTEENHVQSQMLESSNMCEKIIEATEAKIDSTDSKIESSNIATIEPKIESQPKEMEAQTVSAPVATCVETKPAEKILSDEAKHVVIVEEKRDPMEGYRPVPFDPEELNALRERRAALGVQVPQLTPSQERELYKTPAGDIIGTHQGIVDGLEEAVVDAEVAKEFGKPGITEEKIAELISGEAEMLREAHVMGLSRVLASHMHRADDVPSVDFKKIKPIVESLKDSEVLKALNEELLKEAEERKKKEEKKWTTFLQKPKRPVPKAKFGYYKDMEIEEVKAEPYKPKIVKQPKPKVAPDYKPKDFNTGLLPWEERALREPTPPPVDPEDPILIPEEAPEILEAVDPLPESEVPDLEDSGIPLPPPEQQKEPSPPPEEAPTEENQEELDLEAVIEETEKIVEENLAEEMDRGNIAEQIMTSVQNMVDPNAPVEQQLAQMRAQLAALAQLPGVIQQSLELVTRQLSMLSQQETNQSTVTIQEMTESDMTPAAVEETEVSENIRAEEQAQPQEVKEDAQPEPTEPPAPTLTPEEIERMRREEELMLEEQRKMEKQKKIEVWNEIWPWGNSKSYNRQYRINFMKYEKPPVSLDHLKDSDTYKMIHNMEQTQPKRVEMLTPVMAEVDYREKCRSMTPCADRLAQQMQP